MEPSWPEWGASPDHYYPWHIYTGSHGDHHVGYLLDTCIAPDMSTGVPIVYDVLRCEPCLSIHVTPLPSQEALATYYAQEFYQREKPDYVDRYEQDRLWWERCVHQPILEQCRAYIAERWANDAYFRFLDIGAGPGIALDVAQRLRFDTFGIEPNIFLCQMLEQRGHAMWHGTLDTWRMISPSDTFEMIYAYEVLEHVLCPDDFLLRCYDLLDEGGILAVVVPNEWNYYQILARQKLSLAPYWISPPQHLFYWTPKTLQLALRRCGFQLLDMRGTYPIDRNLLAGINYIGNDVLGRECHQRRMQEELQIVQAGWWPRREDLYRSDLERWRIGREIVAIGRKI